MQTIAPRRINTNIFINVRDEYTQKTFIKAIEDNVWDVFTPQALSKLQNDVNDRIQKGTITNSGLEDIKTDLAHLKKVVVIGDDLSKSLFYVRENLEALFNKGVGHKYIVRTGSSGAYKYKYKEDKGSISSKKKPVLKFGYDGEKNGAMYKDYFIWKDDGKFYIWKQLGEEAGSDDDPDASFNTEAEVINYINKINKFEQTYSKEQAKIYAEGGVPLSKVEESKLKADLIKLKKVKMSTPSHQLHIRHIEKVLEEGKKAYGDRGIFELLMQ